MPDKIIMQKQNLLTAYESQSIVKKFLPVVRSKIIMSENELKTKKFPVVLKLISKKIPHKSDIGAVIIAKNAEELSKASLVF